jgi:hypothetical protein
MAKTKKRSLVKKYTKRRSNGGDIRHFFNRNIKSLKYKLRHLRNYYKKDGKVHESNDDVQDFMKSIDDYCSKEKKEKEDLEEYNKKCTNKKLFVEVILNIFINLYESFENNLERNKEEFISTINILQQNQIDNYYIDAYEFVKDYVNKKDNDFFKKEILLNYIYNLEKKLFKLRFFFNNKKKITRYQRFKDYLFSKPTPETVKETKDSSKEKINTLLEIDEVASDKIQKISTIKNEFSNKLSQFINKEVSKNNFKEQEKFLLSLKELFSKMQNDETVDKLLEDLDYIKPYQFIQDLSQLEKDKIKYLYNRIIEKISDDKFSSFLSYFMELSLFSGITPTIGYIL